MDDTRLIIDIFNREIAPRLNPTIVEMLRKELSVSILVFNRKYPKAVEIRARDRKFIIIIYPQSYEVVEEEGTFDVSVCRITRMEAMSTGKYSERFIKFVLKELNDIIEKTIIKNLCAWTPINIFEKIIETEKLFYLEIKPLTSGCYFVKINYERYIISPVGIAGEYLYISPEWKKQNHLEAICECLSYEVFGDDLTANIFLKFLSGEISIEELEQEIMLEKLGRSL